MNTDTEIYIGNPKMTCRNKLGKIEVAPKGSGNMEDKLEKLKEILSISTENVSANHWIPAIHEDKHEALAREIVKLFDIEKMKRIAYLEGILTYTIWADHVPNGNERCDKYQKELKALKE